MFLRPLYKNIYWIITFLFFLLHQKRHPFYNISFEMEALMPRLVIFMSLLTPTVLDRCMRMLWHNPSPLQNLKDNSLITDSSSKTFLWEWKQLGSDENTQNKSRFHGMNQQQRRWLRAWASSPPFSVCLFERSIMPRQKSLGLGGNKFMMK